MDDVALRDKGKRLVEQVYDDLLHNDLTPTIFLAAVKSSGHDCSGLTATKHIKGPLQTKRVRKNERDKKSSTFNSEVLGGNIRSMKKQVSTEDGEGPITTKTDFKLVDFNGVINGVSRRYGFCYINLHQGFSTRFSFGSNGQSLIVKIKKPGFYWKDLIHSNYDLPADERDRDSDPYKIALNKAFSPMEDMETLVIDVGEDIMEAVDKDVEIKRSTRKAEHWAIHCVPFLYKDSKYEQEIM